MQSTTNPQHPPAQGQNTSVAPVNQKTALYQAKVEDIKGLKKTLLPLLNNDVKKVERFQNVLTTCLRTNAKLLECDTNSLMMASIACAKVDLDPEPQMGQAYIIPRWNGKKQCNEAQFQIGYQGYLELIRRSGQVTSIQVQEVLEGDFFEYEFGLNEKLTHKPMENAPSDKIRQLTHVWLLVKFRDGSVHWDVKPRWWVEQRRERSDGWQAFKAGKIKTNPWSTDFNEMAKKTIIRANQKFLPKSVTPAINIDSRIDAGQTIRYDQDTGEIFYDEEDGGSGMQDITPTNTQGAVDVLPPEKTSNPLADKMRTATQGQQGFQGDKL